MKQIPSIRRIIMDAVHKKAELGRLKTTLKCDIININLSRIPIMLVYFTLAFLNNLIINDWVNGSPVFLRDWLFAIVIMIYWVLYFVIKLDKIKSLKLKSFTVNSFWILINFYLLMFIRVDIIQNNNVYNYLLGMFLITMIPLLSPTQSFSVIIFDMCVAIYFCSLSGNSDALIQFICGSSLFAMILSSKEYYSYLKIENALQNLQALSERDKLTHLYNRNILDTYVADLWKNCIDKKLSLSAAMVDIDYFKNYNDTYGHVEGDSCLMSIAAAIKQTPITDLCMRYGGEEFILFFASTETSQTIKVIEELKQRINDLQIKAGKGATYPHVSVSVGIATSLSENPQSIDELIIAADAELYNAKNNGRNCISINNIIN